MPNLAVAYDTGIVGLPTGLIGQHASGAFAESITLGAGLSFSGTSIVIAAGTISNAMLANAAVANLSGTNTGDQSSVSGSSGSCAGNAATATALQTARAINGVNFDGTGAITVAAAAGTLTGATLAAGVTSSSLTSFGASPALTTPTITGGKATALTGLAIRSTGAAFDLTLASAEVFTAGRTLTIAMGDAARTLTFAGNATISGTNTGDQTTISGSSGSCTGNAATATALQTGRTINGTTFDGTANITLAAGSVTNSMLANAAVANLSGTNTGDQTTVSGNAGTATTLATARAINGVNFDGSAAITVPLPLTPTAVKTTTYAAAAGDFVPCDSTSAWFTVTLPTAPADKTLVAVKHVIQGGTNTITIAAGGSDVFNAAGGVTTKTLPLLSQAIVLQYKSSTGIWYVVADDLSLASLDLRFAPIAPAESTITFTDITTNNVSTSKHGFAPKLPSDATKYLDGTGAYSVPASGAAAAGTLTGTTLASNVVTSSLTAIGKVATYNGVATTSNGLAAIVASGRFTGQSSGGTNTAATAICTFTPSADGEFEVSGNITVTTHAAEAITLLCTYTDENSNSISLQMLGFKTSSASLAASAGVAGAFASLTVCIRAKSGTVITMKTAGTFSTAVYNTSAFIKQLS